MSRSPAVLNPASTVLYTHRSDVYEVAQDFLQAYRGDYVFCQISNSSYVIIYNAENLSVSQNRITSDGASVYQIDITSGNPRDTSRFSGTAGTIGSFSGSMIQQDVIAGFGYQVDSIDILNSVDSVIWSSSEGLPHLIEGSENYAFAEILLLISCCVFILCDMLFRRVSR